jgi:hypothetical protein
VAGEELTPKEDKAVQYVMKAELRASAKRIAAATNEAQNDPEYIAKLGEVYTKALSTRPGDLNIQQLQMLGKKNLELINEQAKLVASKDDREFKLQLSKLGLEKGELELLKAQLGFQHAVLDWQTKVLAAKSEINPVVVKAFEMGQKQEKEIFDEIAGNEKDWNKVQSAIRDAEANRGEWGKMYHARILASRKLQEPFNAHFNMKLSQIDIGEIGGILGFGATKGTAWQFVPGSMATPQGPVNTSRGTEYANRKAAGK